MRTFIRGKGSKTYSWNNRPLRFTVKPHPMDGTEAFHNMGGYVGHDDGQDIKLGSYVPTTNKDGFCHSPEQGTILNYVQGGFEQWASTGEPVRLAINAVAGSGKTAVAETILKLWTNMGLGREPTIMTAFNTHIASELKAVAKGLRKDLQGFQSMGHSNTASAGGRKLVFDWIRENGYNPVMDDRGIKYRNLSRIAVSNMIDTPKLLELRMVTNGHEEVKSEVAGWFIASRGIQRLVTACMSAGFWPGDYAGNGPAGKAHITEIINGIQHDDVHFAIELFGMSGVRKAVQWVIVEGQTQLGIGGVIHAKAEGFAPESVTGPYSRRMMKPVPEVLASGSEIYDSLGLRFPLVDVKKPVQDRQISQLGCLAKTDKRAGVSGNKKVLAEWVEDGSLCLRTASYQASQMVIGNSAELSEELGIEFEYAKRDGSITLVNLFRAVSSNNFAPVPLTQYRVRVPAERTPAKVLTLLLDKLGDDVEIATEILDDGSEAVITGGDIYVPFADFVFAPVVRGMKAKIPASLLIVDEVQDFSELQGRFIKCFMNEHTNLIAVGDVNQSLYLFNYADSEATAKLIASNGCTVLPMTICWRNSKAVVEGVHGFMDELKTLAEIAGWEESTYTKKGGDYSMHKGPEYLGDHWPEGRESITIPAHLLPHAVELGDLVTCRVNAPLAKLALRTLIDGEKSITLPGGKGSIAESVLKVVRGRMKYGGAHDGFGLTDGNDAVDYLSHDIIEDRFFEYQQSQLEASVRRCGGDLSEAQNEQRYCELMDTASATLELLHGFIQSRAQLGETADTMHFSGWLNGLCGTTEGRDGHDDTVRFASVHRTKGAQGNRAFVVVDQPHDDGTKRTFMLDHCMNTSAEVVQELNAGYVAVTRAKLQTVYVSYDKELMEKYPTWESFRPIWEGSEKPEWVKVAESVLEGGMNP